MTVFRIGEGLKHTLMKFFFKCTHKYVCDAHNLSIFDALCNIKTAVLKQLACKCE